MAKTVFMPRIANRIYWAGAGLVLAIAWGCQDEGPHEAPGGDGGADATGGRDTAAGGAAAATGGGEPSSGAGGWKFMQPPTGPPGGAGGESASQPYEFDPETVYVVGHVLQGTTAIVRYDNPNEGVGILPPGATPIGIHPISGALSYRFEKRENLAYEFIADAPLPAPEDPAPEAEWADLYIELPCVNWRVLMDPEDGQLLTNCYIPEEYRWEDGSELKAPGDVSLRHLGYDRTSLWLQPLGGFLVQDSAGRAHQYDVESSERLVEGPVLEYRARPDGFRILVFGKISETEQLLELKHVSFDGQVEDIGRYPPPEGGVRLLVDEGTCRLMANDEVVCGVTDWEIVERPVFFIYHATLDGQREYFGTEHTPELPTVHPGSLVTGP